MSHTMTEGITTIGEQGALTYKTLMKQAVDIAADWLAKDRMFDGTAPATLRNWLDNIDIFPEHGIGDRQALDEAAEYFLQHALQVHHPLCSAHLHCPTTLASQLAEVLINITNQSMDSWDQSPSATLFEQRLISALREKIGYTAGDAGVFTSGGTQSNLMGLLLAREYYDKQYPASDKSEMVVICSTQAHFSVQQSMLLLGFAQQATICVDCDDSGQIQIEALRQCLKTLSEQGKKPFALVATAGTTDTGAIDPIEAIAQLAKQYHFWLHIDAAWGGILLFSHQYSHRLAGLEQADSITLDFHKQFLQSISCGAFFIKESANYDLIKRNDDYLNPIEDELEGLPNLVAKSLQTTRRFDALKLWMSLRSIGLQRYGAMVDHSIELAQQVATEIKQSKYFELVNTTQIASVLFRVKGLSCDEQAREKLHRYLAQLLFDEGTANLGVTRRGGHVTLKMTLLNPNTRLADVQKLLATIVAITQHYSA